MTRHSACQALVLSAALLFAAPLCAMADEPQEESKQTAKTHSGNQLRRPMDDAQPQPSTATADASDKTWELYKNVTVPAGSFAYVDSKIDFSTHDKVAISARRLGATSAGTSMNGLDFQALWAVPPAEAFAIAEHIPGTKFTYFDAGGFIFQAYGSLLRLVIYNSDKYNDVKLDQVLIYTTTGPTVTVKQETSTTTPTTTPTTTTSKK